MSRLLALGETYSPAELVILQHAYYDACRKLRISHDEQPELRNRVAIAIMAGAHMGERDPATLTAFAVRFGTRPAPKQAA